MANALRLIAPRLEKNQSVPCRVDADGPSSRFASSSLVTLWQRSHDPFILPQKWRVIA
jgi:hypothetical protein